MNYEIIKDERAMLAFIDWLPELEYGEAYYCCLLARSKYCTGVNHISSDKQQLKRFTSTKEFLMEKIRQLECPVGSYMQKHRPLPQESLALYVSLNPRSYEKAAKKELQHLAELTTKPYGGYNPHQEMMSAIQKARSRRIYMDIDFDVEDIDATMSQVLDHVNSDCLTVIRTRGGFHLLVRIDGIAEWCKNTWYNRIMLVGGKDISGDNMIPVPGSYQGGYVPHFHWDNKWND